MSRSIPCRLLLEDAHSGAWNMAVDEAILEHTLAHPEVGVTLRWYRWVEPTLSLGYFQRFEDRPAELVSLACVRRITGGGAILHDRELTYSLVVPAGSWPADSTRGIVQLVHDAFAKAVSGFLEANLHAHRARHPAPREEEPFLCFLRRSPTDVVVQGFKVLGSAQRNRRGTLLQHGSILLERSEHLAAMEGLYDRDGALAQEDLPARITEQLCCTTGFRTYPGKLAPEEEETARQLDRCKYGTSEWTALRRIVAVP